MQIHRAICLAGMLLLLGLLNAALVRQNAAAQCDPAGQPCGGGGEDERQRRPTPTDTRVALSSATLSPTPTATNTTTATTTATPSTTPTPCFDLLQYLWCKLNGQLNCEGMGYSCIPTTTPTMTTTKTPTRTATATPSITPTPCFDLQLYLWCKQHGQLNCEGMGYSCIPTTTPSSTATKTPTAAVTPRP